MILDDRQRLSAVQRIDRLRRSTTNEDVLYLCDLALKLIPLTKPVTANPPPRVTLTPPARKPPPKSVTSPPPKKARGRPPSPNAKTPAQRAKAYRERKAAAKPS